MSLSNHVEVSIPDIITMEHLAIHYKAGADMSQAGGVFNRVSDTEYHLRRLKDCKVTTMTLVAFLKGSVQNLRNVCYLLPVVYPEKGKVYPPGTITSTRCPGKDGIPNLIRGTHGGVFKNSIFVDIWVSNRDKHISTRLCPSTIQMTGPSSEEMGLEASTHLIDHVIQAMAFLLQVKQKPETFMRAIEWFEMEAKGESLLTYKSVECISVGDLEFDVYDDTADNYIQWPSETKIESLDGDLKYFAEQIVLRFKDLKFVSELSMRARYICDMTDLATEDLGVDYVSRSLVNYNYQVRNSIDRHRVVTELIKLGFQATYTNTVRPHIKVIIDSAVTTQPGAVTRRKDNDSSQMFLIHASGTMMHTGPGGPPMEDCYVKLMVALIVIFDKIRREAEV